MASLIKGAIKKYIIKKKKYIYNNIYYKLVEYITSLLYN